MTDIEKEDLEQIYTSYDWKPLSGTTVLVTGATGLIGHTIVNALLYIGKRLSRPITVIALIRNVLKAQKVFQDAKDDKNLIFLEDDVTSFVSDHYNIDYIIHGASMTSSRDFIYAPVEVIDTAIEGTKHCLQISRKNKIKGFVYLSSMEVYGAPETDEKIFEDHGTNLDTGKVRTSYPESKRLCESLCVAYANEYHVPAKIVRLTQTFGPGVEYNDGRVFAEFARCAIEGKDIILKTKGETKREYLYTADAVTGILITLLRGNTGEIYNLANEETYCSIYDMAQMVCECVTDKDIHVLVMDNEDSSKYGYAPILKMNLSTKRIKRLGWKALYDLPTMFYRMIVVMHQDMK